MAELTPRGDVEEAVANLWIERRQGVIDRISTLEAAGAAIAAGALSEDLRSAGLQEVHKLKGTLATFGFRQAPRLLGTMEEAIGTARGGSEAVGRRLVAESSRLRELLEQGPEPRTPPRPVLGPAVVITGDPDLANQLAESAARDFEVIRPCKPEELWEAVTAPATAALVIVRPGAPDPDDLDLLGRIAELPDPVPSVVVADAEDLAARIRLSGLGATRILPTGLAPTRVMQTVALVLGQHDGGVPRVLVVDDDEAILDVVELLLGREGIQVDRLTDPTEFWRRLSESSPDLVVLDEQLPNISGLELCRVIRSDAQWCNLPVMFLTARNDADFVESVFEAGADDFVTKPIVGPELTARIRNRLERSRLLRQMAEIDPLTGVANRSRSEEDLYHLVALSTRTTASFSLVVIDLDHFKQVNDVHGHATGDVVLRRFGSFLRQALRTNDVVGRWGGEEFVFGLFGSSRKDAANRCRTLMESFAAVRFRDEAKLEFSVSFSAGVAGFPEDGRTVADLYRAADRALYQAKAGGRALVVEVELDD